MGCQTREAPLKITIVTKTWSSYLGEHERPCPACGASGRALVLREYRSLHLGEIPLFCFMERYAYRCGLCRASTPGPRPAGAPPIPFMHRFGAIVIFVIPFALVMGGLEVHRRVQRASSAAHQAKEQPFRERAAKLRDREKALNAAAQERLVQCLELRNHRGAPRTAATQKPGDPSALRAAPVVGDVRSRVPQGTYFGAALSCALYDPQKPLDFGSHGGMETERDGERLAQLERVLAEREGKGLPPMPPVVVKVEMDFLGGAPSRQSVATATWLRTSDRAVLAVAHSDVAWIGDPLEPITLVDSLVRQTAKW